MLTISTKPYNPNKNTSSHATNWDKNDIGLALSNLNSIQKKDITITNKSIDYYKNATNAEIISEIIATWNLTQYNVLSGVQSVLELNDRILRETEGRNKLINQCVKKLNYFQARTDRVDFMLMKTATAMPEVTINDIKAQQKRKNIWTIASCQDETFNEEKLNDNIFYNLKIEENINTLQMTEEINNKPNFKIFNKILTISNEVSLTTVTDTANPRQPKIQKSLQKMNTEIITNINKNENELKLKSKIKESKSQSHITIHNIETPPKSTKNESAYNVSAQCLRKPIVNAAISTPNAIEHMNKGKQIINPKINHIKNNRKKNKNLNHRKKKKYKKKKKIIKQNKLRQQKHYKAQQTSAQTSQEADPDANASIQLKREAAAHFAKQNTKRVQQLSNPFQINTW